MAATRPRAPATRAKARLLGVTLLVVLALVLVGLTRPAAAGPIFGTGPEALGQALARLRHTLWGPPLVAIQIGHLDAADHPEELAALRVSTGGEWGDALEVEVNRSVAEALAERLRARGLRFTLLPATVPPGLRADVFVSLHADASPDPTRRGYKSAVFIESRNRWDDLLKSSVDERYLAHSGLPDDDRNVSGDMLEYYAFNPRFRHSLARGTPALIVEMGYLSHPEDMQRLARPDAVAEWLELGIVDFLVSRGRLPADRVDHE